MTEPTEQDGRDLVPPHYDGTDKYDRHPKDAEWFDPRKDPMGEHVPRGIRRLNFACDLADPRAPNQMALVLREDLMRILGQLVWMTARVEHHKARSESPAPPQGEWRKGFPRSAGYPDFVEDRDGLDRLRETSRQGDGHDMCPANKNTVFRMVQTIDKLMAELDRRAAAPPPPQGLDEGVRSVLAKLVANHDGFLKAQGGHIGNQADAYNYVASDWNAWDAARALLAVHPQGGEPLPTKSEGGE